MVWLTKDKKLICSAVSTEYQRVTDRQTDGWMDRQESCDIIVRDMHTRRAVKTEPIVGCYHLANTVEASIRPPRPYGFMLMFYAGYAQHSL